jgi:hypothetical protein
VTEQTITPPQLARRWGVHVSKVLAFIRAGELGAVNLALRADGRPRWRILPEAVVDFESRRAAVPPVPVSRRRRLLQAPIKEYF